MKFTLYNDLKHFASDTLEILLENEVQNNLPISFIKNENNSDSSSWILATIQDENGSVMLTAACTPPYNIVLFETKNIPNDTAVKLLSDELKSLKIKVPGVLAQQNLAHRFSQNYAENDNFHLHVSMNIMQLDEVFDVKKSPGFCRELNENDLFYMPYWERAFEEDCKLNLSTLQKRFHKINQRIGKNTHYIWENQHPVACCVNHRNTENGAGIGFVYTPPHYRGNGYATSVVAELSQNLLERGNKFCFLFADAANPISCGIYRKIGFKDLCVVDQIHFNF